MLYKCPRFYAVSEFPLTRACGQAPASQAPNS